MKRKEYIQSAVVLVLAVVIGGAIAFFIDRSNNVKQAPTGDVHVTDGTLQVVNATNDQGTIQSNTDASLTGVPAQSVPEASNPSGSSLQNTGGVNVSSGTSSGLQGSASISQ